ncbi:Rha family transcriptional regulator [Vreelandella alkaliphila]|uniref:Rha family transcriptional regulator n=1 Tax=Vreelandella alkaliphila TaxID=272774 RepID=UPI0039F60953
MNQMLKSQSLTMSSREIAELTGKRHGDVIRDIRTMIEQIGDDADLRHVVDDKDSRGYTAELLLDRYHTEVLVTGYDVKRRAAVITVRGGKGQGSYVTALREEHCLNKCPLLADETTSQEGSQ